MKLKYLDHVNLRTSRLAELVRFYVEVLGLTKGERPPFPFGGAWLCCGERPVVHLVEVAEQPADGSDLRLEHFAFRAEGLAEFLKHLREHGVDYRLGQVPGFATQQVNLFDPDGNHIHVDFDASEPER
jgi:catechol 2,3-dioxygenase-like lactoylglutathione lyase family enzyme